jgi:rhodanese-related sulfurtransferase
VSATRLSPIPAVLALLVVALVAGACGPSAPAGGPGGGPAAMPPEVDVTTAATLERDGAFILDVREPDEWAAGHIDGATLIPLGQLSSRTGEVPRDRQVVVVCRSGNRSAQGRDILLGAGFKSVTSMAGGMNDWAGSGYRVVTGE